MPAADLSAKVREYEQFANDVLKVDLQKTTAQRAKYQAEVQELEELKNNIEHLQEQQKVRPELLSRLLWAGSGGASGEGRASNSC
jgi:hypothetical protein